MNNTVAIVPCSDYEEGTVRSAMEQLLESAGGLDWVTPGMNIAVKLNLVTAHDPDSAVTTHPALVKELCRQLIARGASVTLGDSPGGLYNRAFLEGIYRKCGITAAAKECGAHLNTDFSVVTASIPDGVAVHTFTCTQYLLKADAIIDFCKLKTHALTAYTGACKNMFGGVAGMEKAQFHSLYPTHEQFGNAMVDLCQFFAPRLSICDGVVGMEGNGPSSGEPRKIGALLASENPHALDLCAAYIIGLGAKDVPTLSAAHQRGLCPDNVSELDIIGDADRFILSDYKLQPKSNLSEWKMNSRLLTGLIHNVLRSKPQPDENCIGCGKCRQFCPADAIVIEKGRAVIDRKKCICCFCCGEFCPVGSVKPKMNIVARMLGKGGRRGV